MREDEIKQALKDYENKPNGKTGQKLLKVVKELLNSRVYVVSKCSECPSYAGSILPQPTCLRTNKVIDSDKPICDLDTVEDFYTSLYWALEDPYVDAHYEE